MSPRCHHVQGSCHHGGRRPVRGAGPPHGYAGLGPSHAEAARPVGARGWGDGSPHLDASGAGSATVPSPPPHRRFPRRGSDAVCTSTRTAICCCQRLIALKPAAPTFGNRSPAEPRPAGPSPPCAPVTVHSSAEVVRGRGGEPPPASAVCGGWSRTADRRRRPARLSRSQPLGWPRRPSARSSGMPCPRLRCSPSPRWPTPSICSSTNSSVSPATPALTTALPPGP